MAVAVAAALLLIAAGCGAVVHSEQRRRRWSLLSGPLLPWWQTLPLAWARIRMPPFERSTQSEQFGTTAELVAGVAAIGLGCLVIWALKSGSATVR
jgi:hypothetical protein